MILILFKICFVLHASAAYWFQYQRHTASRSTESVLSMNSSQIHNSVIFIRIFWIEGMAKALGIRFIGWKDPNLTKTGEIEARVAGQVLLKENISFDLVFTSLLKRSIKTSWVILDELGLQHIPIITDWRLNERCYGALVGQNKKECVKKFGKDQVKKWRRSFDIPPPPISEDSPLWPGNDPKYDFLPKTLIPRTESLKDTMARSVDMWENTIKPVIQSGKRVLVCGHENNLRSLLKHIDRISDEDISHVEIPRAVPLVYHFTVDMRPIKLQSSAEYLSGAYIGDPEELEAIKIRDESNVYDISFDENLEMDSKNDHFAAKLDDLLPPCDVETDHEGRLVTEASGKEDCRETAIEDTPLLLYDMITSRMRNQ